MIFLFGLNKVILNRVNGWTSIFFFCLSFVKKLENKFLVCFPEQSSFLQNYTKCLSIGTPKIINFPSVPNEK